MLSSPFPKTIYYSHFTDKDTEGQRDTETGPSPIFVFGAGSLSHIYMVLAQKQSYACKQMGMAVF